MRPRALQFDLHEVSQLLELTNELIRLELGLDVQLEINIIFLQVHDVFDVCLEAQVLGDGPPYRLRLEGAANVFEPILQVFGVALVYFRQQLVQLAAWRSLLLHEVVLALHHICLLGLCKSLLQ